MMDSATPESLRRSWSDYDARRQKSITPSEKYDYQNVYAKGYLLTDGTLGDFVPAGWEQVTLQGGYKLAIAPDLPYSYLPDSQGSTLVLGHAFLKDQDSIRTSKTAQTLQNNLVTGPGFDAFEEIVLACSGRFLAIAIKARELRVYTDPMASLTCFWGQRGRWKRSTYLASHSALIALSTEQSESTSKTWIMTHPEYVSPGGKTLPALITPHDSSTEVFANCYLSIRGSVVAHRRYFPAHALEALSLEDATDIFIEEMRFNTRAWLAATDHTYLALTAGQDSRAVLSTSLDLFNAVPDDVTLMTYHFFDKGVASTATDLLKANQMALDAGLRFKVVDIGGFENAMKSLYNSTFSGWARFPTLASAFYHQLQADSSIFIGIGGGIGTAFFAKRGQDTITPEWLAGKYSNSAVSKDPKLISKFQEYIAYTEFTDDRLHGYDLHDLFHWEHRLTKWAGASYAEYGLTATVALPFNSRRLIEAMLSLPYKERESKAIYAEVVKRSGIS